MKDLIRESFFGQCARLVTGRRVLRYPEEVDPSIWTRYVHEEKSTNMCLYGTPARPSSSDDDSDKHNEKDTRRDSFLMDGGRGHEHQQEQIPQRTPHDVAHLPRSQGLPSSSSYPSSSSGDVAGPHGERQQHHGGRETSQDMLRGSNGGGGAENGRYVDPEKGRDVYVVDWYGPDDPANPMNWSNPKKFFVTFEICFLTFSVYIGSAIFSAGITDVMTVFGVSQVAATLGLTLFVAGYAVGPMLWAPMSEIPQIGRNPVYIITLAVFVVFQVPTALATNFGMLLAFRFLTGFIGSPSLATGGASIGDMYTPSKRTYGMAVWGFGAVCGPTLGPLVGGFAVEARGWSWTIWEIMWLSGFCLALLVFFLPETSSANILYRRTRRLRRLTGNDKLTCEPELAGQDMTGKDVVRMALIRPFTLLFTEPIVFLLDLYIALIYGLLYIWFESFPLVFIEIYGFTLGTEGLAFLGILIGIFVVAPPLFWYQHRYIEPKFNENGELRPEWRLPPAFVGAFAIPICLFWFGWTSRPDIHWIVPIIGTAWFSVGAFLLFNSVLNYLSDAYPVYAASVLAGNDFFRSMLGAGFPLFATAMYTKLGVGWASSTLGFISIAFIPIPFVLFKYGHWLRKKSKHARHDF